MAPPPDLAALAGMSDASVRKATGKTWAEWTRALDAVDAASRPHREIADLVHEKFKVPGWWAQTVTVGYERIRGLREIGQRRGGSYEASKSRTFAVPMARLFEAFEKARIRNRWIPDLKLTVRKATPGRSMRISVDDGTSLELWFTEKGAGKSQVAIQHTKLPSKADAENRKRYWAERFDRLAELLG
ncbi:MAG TPA: hypothetical protein VMT00_07990 [Thermoanaerobaculia bacterium]|nr:hypothetical protein [Thermoanaerobaculia bacterium]